MKYVLTNSNQYQQLKQTISQLLQQGRQQAIRKINNVLVHTYWQIGKHIVEFEQQGNERAEYGTKLLNQLAKDLKAEHGKGFSRRNVLDMRRFYLAYPKWQTVSAKLSWSHYTELLSISDELSRSFYEQQCIKENWSVRELKRQRNAALFERLALSKNKQEILTLSGQGQILEQASDLVQESRSIQTIEKSDFFKKSDFLDF